MKHKQKWLCGTSKKGCVTLLPFPTSFSICNLDVVAGALVVILWLQENFVMKATN